MKVGDSIILTTDIYNDGADHHPPGYCARKGETVIVRGINDHSIAVSHEDVTDSSFLIYPNEYREAL
jgi:hypothetical protein